MRSIEAYFDNKNSPIDNLVTIAEEIVSTNDIVALKDFIQRLKFKLPITVIASRIKGKEISTILDSLLKETDAMLESDDSVFLEKYLAFSRENPVVKSTCSYDDKVYDNIAEESLTMLQASGIKQTILFYGLVKYHMASHV